MKIILSTHDMLFGRFSNVDTSGRSNTRVSQTVSGNSITFHDRMSNFNFLLIQRTISYFSNVYNFSFSFSIYRYKKICSIRVIHCILKIHKINLLKSRIESLYDSIIGLVFMLILIKII